MKVSCYRIAAKHGVHSAPHPFLYYPFAHPQPLLAVLPPSRPLSSSSASILCSPSYAHLLRPPPSSTPNLSFARPLRLPLPFACFLPLLHPLPPLTRWPSFAHLPPSPASSNLPFRPCPILLMSYFARLPFHPPLPVYLPCPVCHLVHFDAFTPSHAS